MANRCIHPNDLAGCLGDNAGGPYQPSAGTGDEIFHDLSFAGCRRGRVSNDSCSLIKLAAWSYDIDDEGYTTEWQYGAEGQPRCRAFEDRHRPARTPRCKATDDLFGGMAEAAGVD